MTMTTTTTWSRTGTETETILCRLNVVKVLTAPQVRLSQATR
jgi:hypothetical protein